MTKSTNYLKIGVVVLIAIILFVIAVIFLGANTLFQKHYLVETYFNESVQGLAVGSPVKYRGVQIGTVSNIGFSKELDKDIYMERAIGKFDRFIYVEMQVDLPFAKSMTEQQLQTSLEHASDKGLRVRLSQSGFTGTGYLEIDYLNPEHNVPLPAPPNLGNVLYIPSTASVFTQLSDTVQKVFRQLESANVPGLIKNINKLVENTDRTITGIKLDEIRDNANQAVLSFKEAAGNLNTLTLNVNRVVNEQKIQNTLNNVEALSYNLRDLSSSLKQYPSQAIFGKPPKPLDFTKHENTKN